MMRNRNGWVVFGTLVLAIVAAGALGAEKFPWQSPHAKVLPTGDLQWAPHPFAFEAGESVRYIDFEAGDDANDGTSKERPWKHHPWDAAAKDNAAACTGIHTYIFKGGVTYRGQLLADESGKPGDPIRLTRDPAWGDGEAVLAGSERVNRWTRGADHKDIPDPGKVWFADIDFAPRCVWMVDDAGQVTRIALARTPNWKVSDPEDVKSEWWTWQIPEWWKNTHKAKGKNGVPVHLGIDPKHLTESPDYYEDAIVWSEYGIVMGSPFPSKVELFDAEKKAVGFQGPVYKDSMRIISNNRYFLENKPHYLDAPGEFWFRKEGKGGRLYLRLPDDADPNQAIIEAGNITSIIDSSGMSHVHIAGLTFRFTNVHWDYHERFFIHKDVECACIRLLGSGRDIRVANCRFDHVNKAVRLVAIGNHDRIQDVAVTDNEIRETDHGAVTVAEGGGWGTVFPPFGTLGHVDVLRNRLHRIGLRPFRFGHGHAVDVRCAETSHVAGNVLTRCYGAGLFVFGGKMSHRASDAPLSRVLIHHNKVVDSLLNTNDWGGIEFWQIGPAYLFSNISGNPNGFWNWKWMAGKKPGSARLGMAYYLDGGNKSYVFNNIAWGGNNDLNSKYCCKNAFNEASANVLNDYFNNTAYKFATGHNCNPSGGRHKYLGNLWVDISDQVFSHGKRYDDRTEHTQEYPYDSIAFARNVFHKISGDYGHFEFNGKSYKTAEAFSEALDKRNALATGCGVTTDTMPLRAPDRHDFRPTPDSAAIDRGARCFVPWSLYRMVGEWNFWRNNSDPTVILDQHFYAAPYYANRYVYHEQPTFPLKGVGIDAAGYVEGPLENWTRGALTLNGKDQYLSCANDVLAQTFTYKAGRDGKEKRTVAKEDFFSPAVRSSSFLLEFYLRLEPAQAGGVLMQKMDADNGFSLAIGPDGRPNMTLKASGKEAEAAGNQALNDGEWHHLIAEVDRRAGKINLYFDGRKDRSAPGLGGAASLYSPADLYVGGTPHGRCLPVTLEFARVSLGTLADARTTIEELYAWQFDGPHLRDFTGVKPADGKRDAGAVEAR
jgi:hypothetical protein